MAELKEKKFGYVVQPPCPHHPPFPPPPPGVTVQDLMVYINQYVDVRAKQIYNKLIEKFPGGDMDSIKAQILESIEAELPNMIETEVGQTIETKVQEAVSTYVESTQFTEILNSAIAEATSSFVTQTQVNEAIASATQNLASTGYVDSQIENALTGLSVSWDDITNKPDLVTSQVFDQSVADIYASISTLSDSVQVLTASVSSFGENLDAMSSQIARLSSSISTLASTKRDYTDRTWKYTKTTDPVMYGVKKFYVTKDEDGQEHQQYDLIEFDETNKVWSENDSAVTIKAYSSTLYAVIDENNQHTFEYEDETYDGWEFYRYNDSATQFLVDGGANIEYNINLTRRSDGALALIDDIPTVPTNVTAFTNDAGYITTASVQSMIDNAGHVSEADVNSLISQALENFNPSSSGGSIDWDIDL